MNKSMITGIICATALAATAGAYAGFDFFKSEPTAADVISSTPIKKTYTTPREECHDEQVTHTKPVKDTNRIAGSALGAVAGGLLGNQFGGGKGKTLATVAGAAAGGYAGNQTQKNMQAGDTYTTIEQRCKTVNDKKEKIVGYDVKYRIGDKEGQVKMDHDPGKQIPIKDGQLVLKAAETAPITP
jgi:uncharacterized protein YcfJ